MKINYLNIQKPDLETELASIISMIETAKQGGDYYAANLLFVAALHILTRGQTIMRQPPFEKFYFSRHAFVEAEEFVNADYADYASGEVGYYDLLNIRACGMHTCIPMPMLHMSITEPAYRLCETFSRGEHNRRPDTSAPDVWSEPSYGYLRMGEEAAPLYLSEHGMEGEAEEAIDNETVLA